MSWLEIVAQARRGAGPLRHARALKRWLLSVRIPVFRPFWAILYAERDLRRELLPILLKVLYREPILRYRCAHVGKRLSLWGSVPLIYGDGEIRVGDDAQIGGRNTWAVGYKVSTDARLTIGNRTVVGYQNFLSVAKSVIIGDDTMLASNVQIYDNPNHPLEPDRRLRKESFRLDETAPVVIGRNVWLATGCIVLPGVTIGDGSVVGAGSVVTRDIPPYTLAAGNPARVIRSLDPAESREEVLELASRQ